MTDDAAHVEAVRSRRVLQSVLMQTLARFPEGASLHVVYEEIERRFNLPAAWYRQIPGSTGYEELQAMGYADWRDIPQEKLIELVPTEPQWQNEIRWARNALRKEGLLDLTAPRGIWRLSSKGAAVAAVEQQKPTLSPAERRIATPVEIPRWQVGDHQASSQSPSERTLSLRQTMLRNLSLLVAALPLADLELIVDLARVVRQRSLEDD